MKVEHYYEPNSKILREEPQVFTRWIDPTIEQLQQENNQLQQAKDKLQNDYQEARDKIDELINKIDKAIEYINVQKLDFRNDDRIIFIFKKLNELLGDKENE